MINGAFQAGLEIGSTTIKCVIASITAGKVKIEGYASEDCKGIREGSVVNIAQTVESIKRVIERSEELAKHNIKYVNLGIHGLHIESKDNEAATAIFTQDKEIGVSEIRKVIETARAIQMPIDRQILHSIPKEYIVDNQRGVVDPRGMVANHLKVEVYLVTALASAVTNLERCVEKAGIEVNNSILTSLGTAGVTLTDEEKKRGCLLIDIGGTLTEVTCYSQGAIRGFKVVNNGGYYITNDIAYVLKTSFEEARKIKEDYGFAVDKYLPKEGKISYMKLDGRSKVEIPVREISKIILDRLDDIYAELEGFINILREKFLIASCVVTGGGAALPGIAEYFEEKTGLTSRIGLPINCIGDDAVINSPAYTGAIGLLKYDINQEMPSYTRGANTRRGGLLDWLKKFF